MAPRPNVVMDRGLHGWGATYRKSIAELYFKILTVGKHPDLPPTISDKDLAKYCFENQCDLLTRDQKSYGDYFDAGAKAIKIFRTPDRTAAYMIKIVE